MRLRNGSVERSTSVATAPNPNRKSNPRGLRCCSPAPNPDAALIPKRNRGGAFDSFCFQNLQPSLFFHLLPMHEASSMMAQPTANDTFSIHSPTIRRSQPDMVLVGPLISKIWRNPTSFCRSENGKFHRHLRLQLLGTPE